MPCALDQILLRRFAAAHANGVCAYAHSDDRAYDGAYCGGDDGYTDGARTDAACAYPDAPAVGCAT